MVFIKLQKIFDKFSKFAHFWPKNAHLARFFSFRKNGPKIVIKVAKNGPYKLLFEPDVYFYDFCQIPKDF